MKTENYYFKSTLLISRPMSEGGYTFAWLGSLHAPGETVDVIAFNCKSSSDFRPMMEKDLAELKCLKRKGSKEVSVMKASGVDFGQQVEQMRNLKKQIRFIKRTLTEMSNPVFVKTPPKELLDVVSQQARVSLNAENVVYVKGISHIR